MKVKVIERFRDKDLGVDREVDSIFECNDERGNELIEYGLVVLEEETPNPKVDLLHSREAELVKKESVLSDKEKELIEREKKVSINEAKLIEKETLLKAKEAELESLGKVLTSRAKDLDLREDKLKKAEPKDKK